MMCGGDASAVEAAASRPSRCTLPSFEDQGSHRILAEPRMPDSQNGRSSSVSSTFMSFYFVLENRYSER